MCARACALEYRAAMTQNSTQVAVLYAVRIARGLLLTASVLTVLFGLVRYPTHLAACQHTHDAAYQYVISNCGTAEEMRRLGTFSECERRMSILDDVTPHVCAWHRVLSDVGGCGKQGCVVTMRDAAVEYLLLFVTIVGALIVGAYVLSFWQARIENTLRSLSILPVTDSSKTHTN